MAVSTPQPVQGSGFPGLRYHDLRHSFITLMAENNVPLPVVQSMVGHMSPRMTRYYTHISNDAARRAVELLDQKWSNFVDIFVDTENRWTKKTSKLN